MSSKPRTERLAVVPSSETETTDVSYEVMTVTPDRAKDWLARYAYPGQRPVRKGRVDELVALMARGEFDLSQITLVHVADQAFLVNGQHRLHAIVELGIGQRMTLERRQAPDLAAVGRIYASFDRPMIRSYRDVYRSFGLGEEAELPDQHVSRTASAAVYIAAGFVQHVQMRDRELRAPGKRRELVLEWAPAARVYFDAIGNSARGWAQRLAGIPICAVGLATCRYQPEKARAFWSAIGDGAGLVQGEPAHTAFRFIIDNPITSATYGRLSRGVARAWNAHHEGEPLTLIKVPDPGAPIVIRGTPFVGAGR